MTITKRTYFTARDEIRDILSSIEVSTTEALRAEVEYPYAFDPEVAATKATEALADAREGSAMLAQVESLARRAHDCAAVEDALVRLRAVRQLRQQIDATAKAEREEREQERADQDSDTTDAAPEPVCVAGA